MKFRVVVFAEAKDDIRRNALWWAEHHSKEQAYEWANVIDGQLESLSTFPERCALIPEHDRFPGEVRQLMVGIGNRPGYRAVFSIEHDEVHVLTIRAGSQAPLQPSDITL